jgi:hypothetical protein
MKDVFIGLRKLAEGGWEGHSLDRSVVVRAESRRGVEQKVTEIIHRSTGTSAEIRFVPENEKRRFGSAKGEFTVPDDFNDPLNEIDNLFY